MPITCQRCGATLDEAEVGDRFQGTCPKCLAGAAFAATTTGAPVEDLPSLAPGRMFQGLEVVERLGAGGMGVVYKARQPHLDRFVALKVLPRHLAAEPDFVERFRREAKALASLSHANIVGVHDFGIAEDVPYLVMEFVDGVNLRAMLAEKKLTPEQAFHIVPQLCDALEYAHEEGIVHRDVKPENILVDRKGRVKIADFGLAKLLGKGTASGLTKTAHVMGTPTYMAPEQYEDPKRVDHRADIYSMGVVFYEMLTGELPMGSFQPPSQKVHVDVRLDEVVLKALAKEPDRRYQHASEVKQEVTRISATAESREAAEARVIAAARAAIRAARRAQVLSVVAIMLIGIAAYQFGGAVWTRVAARFADSPAPTPQAVVPAWLNALAVGDDDLPGDSTSPPLLHRVAAAPKEVGDLVQEAVRRMHVAMPEDGIRAIRVLYLNPSELGFIAVEAGDAVIARSVVEAVSKWAERKTWSYMVGSRAVVAFTTRYDAYPTDRATFEHLVNWLAARLKTQRPFEPRTIEDSYLSSRDLPIGVEMNWLWGQKEGEEERDWRIAKLQSWGIPVAKADVGAAALHQTSPGGVRVVQLDIPRHSARVALAKAIGEGSWRSSRVRILGSIVVLCLLTDTRASAGREFDEIDRRLGARLGFETSMGPERAIERATTEAKQVIEHACGKEAPLGFALRRGSVVEIRLPGGKRAIMEGGKWRVVEARVPDARVALSASDVDVRVVLDQIVRAGGADYVFAEWPLASVHLELADVPWADALSSATASAGLLCRREGEGAVLVYRENAFARRVASPLATTPEGPRVTIDEEELDVRETLLGLARTGKTNLVMTDDVSGRVSARFVDALWPVAFSAIVECSGAAARRDAADILRVDSAFMSESQRIGEKRFGDRVSPLVAPVGAPRLSFELVDAEVAEVVAVIARQAGASVAMAREEKGWLPGDTRKARRLTVLFRDVVWTDALTAVAWTAGYAPVQEAGGVVRLVDPGTLPEPPPK